MIEGTTNNAKSQTTREERKRDTSVTEAIDEEMKRDSTVFVIGEDVSTSHYTVLADKYGKNRVIDTPISETAILGGAIGAAATGMRPVASLHICDFMGVCADELINQLQMRYMFGGKIQLPVTILVACGAGMGLAAQHSKSLFAWFMAVNGLQVVVPSTPYDAKGLLKSTIRQDNPTVFITHKLLGSLPRQIPDDEYLIPLGQADIKREGTDVTVVAISHMVHRALAVATKLQEEGISLEVIDPRTLVPFDKKTIIDSIRKTGKLLIISEETRTGSAAAEIAAIMAEEAFGFLKAPIVRVCAPDTPVPYSPPLESYWIPSEEKLLTALKEIIQ